MKRTLKSIRKSAWMGVVSILPYFVAGLLLAFTLVLWTCSSSVKLGVEPVSIGLDDYPAAAGEESGQTVGGDEVVQEPWPEEWEPGAREEEPENGGPEYDEVPETAPTPLPPPRYGEPRNGGPEDEDDGTLYLLEDREVTPEDIEYGEHPAEPWDEDGLYPTGGFLPETSDADVYARALDNLQEGNVVFPERQDMRQGMVKAVSVRVYFPDVPPVVRAMEEHEVVEPIRISNVMCADLLDVEDVFDISPMTERCQVTGRPNTEWLWAVLPHTSGEHQLVLNVTNEIKVDGDDKYRTEIAKMAIVDVEVDLWYTAKGFLDRNWQWFLASFGGLAGILESLRRLLRRKAKKEEERRGAGF